MAAGVGADGDIAGMLSILAFAFTMVTGGNDTTTGMLGGAVQLLHQRPDQRRLLVENPTLIADAVDEFLRLTSPAQGLARTVTRDVTIGDTTIPAGRRVLLLYGSANRDERQYGPDAGELDVTRKPRNILTFSHGAHHCLGAAAARMQSRVALDRTTGALPGLRGRRVAASCGPAAATCGARCRFRSGEADGRRRLAGVQRRSRGGGRPHPRRRRAAVHRADAGVRRHERNRQGCRLFPSHAVPVLREPRGAAHRLRAPRDPSARSEIMQQIDSIEDPRERLIASITAALRMVRENPALAAWFGATTLPHRRRDGRTVRGDHGAGRRVR